MKRYIKSSLEKVYWELYKPSLRNYRFSGQIDPIRGQLFGDVQKIAPYDDADYAWAKVNGNGLIEFIKDGKIVDKMQTHAYEEEDYEDVNEYFNDIIESVAEELKKINQSIKPRMMYD